MNGYDETPSFDNFNELIKWLEDIDRTPLEVKQLIDHMEEYNLDSNSLDDCEIALNSIFDNEYDAEVMHCSYEWIHVSTHLTPQAANAFIERQPHNYGKLRVYVSTTYFSHEFKAIINGFVSGHIKYVETPCEPTVSTLAEIEQFAQCILQRADNDEHIKHYANMILAHTHNS
ncbi:hypothetical protein I3271_05205 [Photobacterium leiognathi]|uniref:hypothetical protein n=1 Tax=Photobacterium leiognathi TaxID=553611 RepID=UPI001EDCA5A0|nr:hypothetical protein [Photobacterium leiognathi]MCG3884078.1 hypothetical protein [Photobacterium leiognathi]